MVVKLATLSPLYADAYPSRRNLGTGANKKIIMDNFVMDCPRRQKLSAAALPALAEDEDEVMEIVEARKPRISTKYTLAEARMRHSPSPPRKDRLLPARILPSLSEDEEP